MTRYAVFIQPYGILRDSIVAWKHRVNALLPGQPYCSHPPHCTLMVAEMTSPKEWLGELACHVGRLSPFHIRVKDTIVFYDDVVTGGHSIAFKAEPCASLYDLQKTIGSILSPFAHGLASELPEAFRKEPYKSSCDAYGFPFLGDHWIPHFSIASLKIDKENPLISEFRETHLEFRFMIQKISIWRVQEDTHRVIAELFLDNE